MAELHAATGYPKSTIVRLLQTLVDADFATNDKRQGGYQVTSNVAALGCGFHRDPMVVAAGAEAARDLTARLRWPAAIAVFDKDAIVVRYSTAPDSPMAPFHSTLNMRLSLATRALGRAFMAHCDATEFDSIASVLGKSDNAEDRFASDRPRLLSILDTIRRRGFAERCPRVKPQTSTLAVPILLNGRVQASLGMTYFSSALEPSEARRRLVPSMERARGRIETELSRLARGSAGGPPQSP